MHKSLLIFPVGDKAIVNLFYIESLIFVSILVFNSDHRWIFHKV